MYAEGFAGKFDGKLVFVKSTDATRPTCGNIYTEGYNFKLVTTCDLEDVIFFETYLDGFKYGLKNQ
jgi:hypothetical protein